MYVGALHGSWDHQRAVGREFCLGAWAEGEGQNSVIPSQHDPDAIGVSAALLKRIPSLDCVHCASPFAIVATAFFLKLKAKMSERCSRWELTSLKTCQCVCIFNSKASR